VPRFRNVGRLVFYEEPADSHSYDGYNRYEWRHDHPELETSWDFFNIPNLYQMPPLKHFRDKNDDSHGDYTHVPPLKMSITENMPVPDYIVAVLHVVLCGIEFFEHHVKSERNAEYHEDEGTHAQI
jgi:hypothetical protein